MANRVYLGGKYSKKRLSDGGIEDRAPGRPALRTPAQRRGLMLTQWRTRACCVHRTIPAGRRAAQVPG